MTADTPLSNDDATSNCPLRVKTPPKPRVTATSEPEVILEGITRKPDIAARRSVVGAIADVPRRRL